jgi:hypothetical protein
VKSLNFGVNYWNKICLYSGYRYLSARYCPIRERYHVVEATKSWTKRYGLNLYDPLYVRRNDDERIVVAKPVNAKSQILNPWREVSKVPYHAGSWNLPSELMDSPGL